MRDAIAAGDDERTNRRPPLTRADLHVHTRASSGSATGWLEALGVAESYSEPERVYDLAKARGMKLVAITDHDTIDGAIELVQRGFDDVIIGEEVTTRFADTRCLLHVLVWMLTPELHEEIEALGLRRDAAALAHWLRDNRLPHALAHPLFDMNRKLCVRELERCALLFGGFEAMNGGHTTAEHRRAMLQFLETSRDEHGSLWPQRWLTAGSDDHGLLNIGRAWTAVEGHCDARRFFMLLTTGAGFLGGRDACTESLAHQFIGVASRFLLDPPQEAREAEPRISCATRAFFNSLAPMRQVFEAGIDTTVNEQSRHQALLEASRVACAEAAGELPCAAAELERIFENPIEALRPGGMLASLIASQTAYIVAAAQHQRERSLLRQLAPLQRRSDELHVALFVDALDHVSGVSRFALDLARRAEQTGRRLTMITCADDGLDEQWPDNVHVAKPVGVTAAPGYPGVRLGVPWAPDLIRLCAEQECDVIHISTPGPVGLAGALTGAILKLPIVGVHHTDLPAYARRLFNSDFCGVLAEQALRTLYGRYAKVLARSSSSAEKLETIGIASDRIAVLTPGIDLSRFSPKRRDPEVWRRYPNVRPESIKALYVGRLSKEKNLDFLAAVWERARRRLESMSVSAELIVIGEGPSRSEFEGRMEGCGCHLLGPQRGEALSQLYASCDFLIFPSVTETLGQVVIEAQASGLPAIVADVGGPRDIVADQVTGRVISTHDADEWTQAIVTIAADANLRSEMSRAAAAHAQQYSFEKTFRSFWSIHQAVAEEARSSEAPAPEVAIESAALRRMFGMFTNASA